MQQIASDIAVEYHHNACMTIETRGERILCDPWFNPAYYGTWKPVYQFNDPIKTVGACDYIWISHIHPDHFDPLFLQQYQDEYRADIISRDELVLDAAHNANLRTSSPPWWVEEVKSHTYSMDNALIVHGEQNDLVNLNDVIFDEKTVSEIIVKTDENPIVFAPYTGAGNYPQCWYDLDDPRIFRERERVIDEHLSRTRRWYGELKPKELFLTAGQYRLVGPLEVLNPFRASIPINRAAARLGNIGATALKPDPDPIMEPDASYDWWRYPGDMYAPLVDIPAGVPDGFTIHTSNDRAGNGDIHIYIDRNLLMGLLHGDYHWNDAGIGSCYFGRREGAYDRKLMDSLEEYHV